MAGGGVPALGPPGRTRSSVCTTPALPPRPEDGRCRPAPHQKTYVISGMISSATMLATLIMGLIAGPAVSL